MVVSQYKHLASVLLSLGDNHCPPVHLSTLVTSPLVTMMTLLPLLSLATAVLAAPQLRPTAYGREAEDGSNNGIDYGSDYGSDFSSEDSSNNGSNHGSDDDSNMHMADDGSDTSMDDYGSEFGSDAEVREVIPIIKI